jgi:uncharacterized protein (TIGR02596 family)
MTLHPFAAPAADSRRLRRPQPHTAVTPRGLAAVTPRGLAAFTPRGLAAVTPRGLAAFTLVELLVVIAVIALIAGLAVPAIEPMMKGSKLTTTADALKFNLAAWRQQAIAENSAIEVRFLSYTDPSVPGQREAYRGYQAGRFRQRMTDTGAGDFAFDPIGNVQKMPEGIVLSSQEQMSSILNSEKVREGSHEFLVEGQNNLPFKSFSFRPDGSTELGKRAGDTWYFTVVQERDDEQANNNPDNFVTLHIDAFNGSVRSYTR